MPRARSLPSISLTRERVFTGTRTAPTRDPTVQLHHHQHRKNASRDPHTDTHTRHVPRPAGRPTTTSGTHRPKRHGRCGQ